jgi:sugar phosphate isomerase/epimerase
MGLEDALRRISALGIKYVELSADVGVHLYSKIRDGVPPLRTKKLLDEFELQPAAIALESDFTVGDAELDPMLDWVRKGIIYCHELGAPILRIFASHIRRGVRVDDALFDRAIANIGRMVQVAEDHGVQLAMENHDALTATGGDMVRIIEGVASPWLGANYDPSNFLGLGGDPVEDGRSIAPYILHCHLKDVVHLRTFHYEGYEGVEMGAGVVDYAGVLRLLHEIDYQGFLSLEYEGGADPVRGTRDGLANLRRLMAAFA